VTTGKLLHKLIKLDRVIGTEDATSRRKALNLYGRFVEGTLHPTDWISAEITKTAENAYRDVQIAFANEIALICEELGANAYRVRELVNTCPGRDMLIPGAGVGGHCIPKDPWLLVSPVIHQKPILIPSAREVNDYMPIRMAQLVEEAMREAGRRIRGAQVAVLGFAYRENTDDARNSPAIPLVRELRRRGADVTIHDPFARSTRGFTVTRDLRTTLKGADCLALVTAHDAYRRLDLKKVRRWMRHRAIVDGRNFFDGAAVKRRFAYRAIGKGEF
jgi:UDP-N-acetyl-D-mannosaminuronic acid dehydrogenase